MSDLRAQAEQLTHRLYHDVPDDFTAWLDAIETALRGVRDAERKRCAAIAREDENFNGDSEIIARAIESGADHAD